QNGKDAQKLNAQFGTMKATDSCQGDQTACINSQFAQCVSGKWVLQACPASLSCVALPDLQKAGTSINCEDKNVAAAAINSCGVSGGLTGDGSVTPAASSAAASS
ncbi:hypothetical protein BDQ12DRAFT_568109, partial [Crucibulum laeve]